MRRRTVLTAIVSSFALVSGCGTALAASTATGQGFVFTGGGYGHGVGMSQFGARGRADAGQTAVQILNAYYPGAPLVTIPQPTIRVKIGETRSFTVVGPALIASADGGPAVATTAPAQALTVTAVGGTVTVQPAGGAAVTLVGPGGVGVIDWNDGESAAVTPFGHHYRYGRLVVRALSADSLEVVIDGLAMQRYLEGLAEVSSSWPTEALRAQAIAGRTFAAYRLAHPQSSRFDIYAATSDQSYVGDDKAAGPQGIRWTTAVADTADQVVTSGGVPIQAFYSSSNGGYSEASSYVFVTAQPYLRAAPDPFDQALGNSNFAWSRTYTGEELAAWLTASGRPDVGVVKALTIGSGVGASGRVDRATILVQGDSGRSYTMTGNQLRAAINAGATTSRDLLSTKFTMIGAQVAGGDPVGSNDSATTSGSTAVVVTGWAADPDTPVAPTQVKVFVNGKLAATVTANQDRPELGRVMPWLGSAHGWSATVVVPSATAQICAFATNIGAGSIDSALGCRSAVRSKAPARKAPVKKAAVKKAPVRRAPARKRRR